MKKFAAGVLTGMLLMVSLACAGGGATATQKFGLVYVQYDNDIRIAEMTDANVELFPGWVIFDDPSWDERFLVPEHKIHWMRIEK